MLKVGDVFPGAPGYLNSPSIGLPPANAALALARAIEDWQFGNAVAPAYDSYIDAARQSFSRLVNVPQKSVAIGSQVSALVAMVAAGVPQGANILCAEEDFTSVIFPFLSRGDLNVRCVPLDRLASSVTDGTDLIAFSLVQSADGRLADALSITAAAQHYEALTLVDCTQAAGWLPIDATRYDFTVTGTYKWLLSPRGTAFLTIGHRVSDFPKALYANWYAGQSPWESIYGPPLRLASSARRFDLSPAWLCWVGTASSLQYLEHIGVQAIYAHNVALADSFRSRLGLDPGYSAIVSLELPETAQAQRLSALSTATRDGKLRVGFHLYNQLSDVERLAEALGIG